MRERFPNLKVYKNENQISEHFRAKWVTPYYMNLSRNDNDWINQMKSLKNIIATDIILKNLGDYNWRSRQTGAYFAAIKNSTEVTNIIGRHLLKSEVCFAGKQYAITLAVFNSPKSVKYLSDYLDYYLKHPELEFDQIQVFEALKYVDEENNTSYLTSHKKEWDRYCQYYIDRFEKIILAKHSSNSIEYERHMEKILSTWNYNRESTFVRKRAETIKKIKNLDMKV